MADLNGDGSPELYVYVASAGSGSYGSLVAYSANRRKSLSEIYLPPITDHATAAQGYLGHDQFAVVEGTLVRRFPVYKPGDSNAAPSGGSRGSSSTSSSPARPAGCSSWTGSSSIEQRTGKVIGCAS